MIDMLSAEPSLWVPLISGLVVLAALHYYRNTHLYWAKRGLKGDRPLWVFSSLYDLFFSNRARDALERVRKYGKIHGIFLLSKPFLVVADAEVIRQICVRDFDAFPNHQLNELANSYQANFLVWLKDDHWRRVRAMMSPQFTSSKVKRMYRLMEGCAEDLLENFREQMISARRDQQSAALVDLVATYSLYTMDGITTCCYGLKVARQRGDLDIKRASTRNALVRDCTKLLATSPKRLSLASLVPKRLLKAVGFHLVPESSLSSLVKRIEGLVELRRRATVKGGNKYDDFLQMLVDSGPDEQLELTESDQAENHHAGLTRESLISDHAKLKSDKEAGAGEPAAGRHRALAIKLTDLEIISEALFVMAAGFETTRASLSTITYLLAHNLHVQERLYAELKRIAIFEDTPVGKQIKFDYNSLTACEYLDAVVSESLRFLTPALFTDRVANRDYLIEKYDVRVPKGSNLLLNLHAVHHDPDYWHEPQRFDPERFMPDQRDKIVPGSYVPFSMGPRHCVGMRFSLTETKLGLAKVLMRFKFSPAPGTNYPPEPERRTTGLARVRNCKVLVEYREDEWN